MIASLDVARKQMVMGGYKLLSRTLELAKELRKQINRRACSVCSSWRSCFPTKCGTTASVSTRRR